MSKLVDSGYFLKMGAGLLVMRMESSHDEEFSWKHKSETQVNPSCTQQDKRTGAQKTVSLEAVT